MTRALLSLGLLWLTSLAVAQPGEPAEPGPKGPAEIIGQAAKARAKKQLEQAPANEPAEGVEPTVPAAAAPVRAAPAANPHGAMPGAPGPLSSAQANTLLPMGTVRVHVLDGASKPVVGEEVRLGVMAMGKKREALTAKTDSSGFALFEKLAIGDGQAYRASVEHEGAKYGAMPFRLPPRGGYDVSIRRLATTRSSELVVMRMGAASVELKEGKFKIVQQVRLANAGSKTYVFPEGGLVVELPEGHVGFQTQDAMTDQKLTAIEGSGFKVVGSLPPGQATLLWAFELPISGSEAHISLPTPWTTMAFRVVADAAPGMSLSVDGMPAPELRSDNGRRYLVAERIRRPSEAAIDGVHIHLTGLPGPGPGRWIATALALLALGVGVTFAFRQPAVPHSDPAALAEQRRRLLEEAAALDGQHRGGEIGPQYHGDEMARLERELAVLLFRDSRLAKKG